MNPPDRSGGAGCAWAWQRWVGAISTAVGIGASLSQVIAGSIVHHFGFNVGFLFLAAVASAALGILYFFMPETRDKGNRTARLNERAGAREVTASSHIRSEVLD